MGSKVFGFCCLIAGLAFAGETRAAGSFIEQTLNASLIQTSGKPTVPSGQFYGYRQYTEGPGKDAFADCLELSKSEGVPIVVIWSNKGCEHCSAFAKSLNDNAAEVKEWLAGNRAVFAYFKDNCGNDGPPSSHEACYDAWKFAKDDCKAELLWPYVGFYYVRDDGTVLTWGSPQSYDSRTYAPTYEKDFAWFKKSYADWLHENGLDCFGGSFAVKPEGLHRYEAEASTGPIEVELTRETLAGYSVATNRLTMTWPGEEVPGYVTNLVWSVGETLKNVVVPTTAPGGSFVSGDISLALYDADGRLRGTNVIACVELENSAGNPRWRGCDGFGEWTMDLQAAKELVAGTDGPAYTLVSVQGSLWCPDCANVERNFLSVTNAAGKNAVVAWAKERNVALVSIDIPNFNGPEETDCASPCLVSRTPYQSTLGRAGEYPQSGAEASLLNKIWRSGLGYLTRNGVSETEAAETFSRNHCLVAKNTDEGGFHRPDDGNKNRTGVPIFVLLRKDGSVAARLTRMASVSPMAADRENCGNYLRRLDEMLAIASGEGLHGDVTEVENGFADAGAIVLNANGGVASNELCHADFQDVFRLDGAGSGTHQSVKVTGETGAEVTLSYVSTNAQGKLTTVLSTNAVLSSEGVRLTATFADEGPYFALIKGANITDDAFCLESPLENHFHPYEIMANSVLVPTERKSTASAAAASDEVLMRVEDGFVYRIVGLAGGVSGKLVARGDDLYEAEVTEDVVLKTSERGGTVEFQIWRPGEIVFETAVERVFEYAPTGRVAVVRRDGGSGAASVTVKWVGEDANAAGRYIWTDQTVSWADGESGTREVGFRPCPNEELEGEGSFYLVLEPGPDCVAEVSSATNTVTIYDTDAPCLEKTEYTVQAYGNFSSVSAMKVLNIREGGRVTVTATRGLPSGMKLAYDAASGSVVLSGVPTKPGTYEVSVTVTEKRKDGKSTGTASVLTIEVGDPSEFNAFVSVKRPAQKLALFAETNGLDRLAGLLDVSITAKGKISAKYTGTETKTLSFAGNWSGFGRDGTTAVTTLESKGGVLNLAMDGSGCLTAELLLPNGYSRFAPEAGFWAEADWPGDDDFTPYKGYYTVELPCTNAVGSVLAPSGAGFVTLTMTSASAVKSGTVRYAGVLSDGSSVSGSTTLRNLLLSGDGSAEVPMFSRTSKNVFGVAVSVAGHGSERWNDVEDANRHMVVVPLEGTQPYVLHAEGIWSFDLWLDAHGSYYVQGVSPLTLRMTFYDKFELDVPFRIAFDLESQAASERYGTPLVMPSAFVWPQKSKLAMDRTTGLSFSFNRQTGAFSGTGRLTFDSGKVVSGSYRGVVVPGWVGAESCCGAATYLGPELPFGRGVFYFRDVVGGKTVTRSLPVVLDIAK